MKSRPPNPRAIAIAQAINVSSLPWVLYVNKNLLPASGGIYFVGTDQEPSAYLGQSQCFRTRFPGHHRKEAFQQLLNENGSENVKIRYWLAPVMPTYELSTFLYDIESYLIKNLKTRFNNTANSIPKTPPKHIRRTFQGPIYVQLNQLGEYYVPRTSDGTSGFYFSAAKLHAAENAVKYRSPSFLISSGSWKEAQDEYGNIPEEWKQYTTLYFLEAGFRACWIESDGGSGREEYILGGNRASFHQVFLNDLPGFKEFSIKYLHTGLTNCSESDFCETLLAITRGTRDTGSIDANSRV